MRKYLTLDYVTGRFFEYSKEEVAGYEKVVNQKDGSVSYRNYFLKGVRGVYKGVELRSRDIGNGRSIEQLQFGIEADGVMYLASMNTKGGNSSYDDRFVIPFIQLLNGMKVGETYLVQPYRFTPSDSKYEKSGVSVKDANDVAIERTVSMSFYKGKGEARELIAGDIPAESWEQDKKGAWSLEPVALAVRNKYISNLLDTITEAHGKDFGGTQMGYNSTSADMARPSSTPTTQVQPEQVTQGTVVVDNTPPATAATPVVHDTQPIATQAVPVASKVGNKDLPF